jgi:hypothetical protein
MDIPPELKKTIPTYFVRCAKSGGSCGESAKNKVRAIAEFRSGDYSQPRPSK